MNTKRNGISWSENEVRAVWNKGREVPNFDRNVWRYDRCGNPINFSQFGNRGSEYGWEIDHIIPVCHNGSDDISNLQPLQWAVNLKKSDSLNFSY